MIAFVIMIRLKESEVYFAIEDTTNKRVFEHRLRDYNNLPEIDFSDVKRLLAVAHGQLQARFKIRNIISRN